MQVPEASECASNPVENQQCSEARNDDIDTRGVPLEERAEGGQVIEAASEAQVIQPGITDQVQSGNADPVHSGNADSIQPGIADHVQSGNADPVLFGNTDRSVETEGKIQEETEISNTVDSTVHADVKPAAQAPFRMKMEAIGAVMYGEEEERVMPDLELQARSRRQAEEEVWTEHREEGTEQKRPSGRRFFSLMNLIKFLLNPVIEEFQEMEKSSSQPGESSSSDSKAAALAANDSDVSETSLGNSSEIMDKDDKKNGTESGRKTKFQCVGHNVTENTTAEVKIVNSTRLLELLSFDKNHSTSDCVLVMFYAPWCNFCASTAPHYNALARAFPQLEVLAVDTVHFSK
jgi:hypothetical protein